jgi:hypothetical protein
MRRVGGFPNGKTKVIVYKVCAGNFVLGAFKHRWVANMVSFFNVGTYVIMDYMEGK